MLWISKSLKCGSALLKSILIEAFITKCPDVIVVPFQRKWYKENMTNLMCVARISARNCTWTNLFCKHNNALKNIVSLNSTWYRITRLNIGKDHHIEGNKWCWHTDTEQQQYQYDQQQKGNESDVFKMSFRWSGLHTSQITAINRNTVVKIESYEEATQIHVTNIINNSQLPGTHTHQRAEWPVKR